MGKSHIIACLFFFASIHLSSQNLSGRVSDPNGDPLYGATVLCLESNQGTSTDLEGKFTITNINTIAKSLIISYVGFKTDTLLIDNRNNIEYRMIESNLLEQVELTAQKKGTFVSTTNPIKTEVITSVELTRAACCDLAGCFGTEASVQPATTNIVTNAKELRLLGLSGVYTQQLLDGFPMIQGLSYTYGISTIPGPIIDNIFIAKGSNSILQGFESISGQINVTTKNPQNANPLYLNAYLNSFAEKQFNGSIAQQGTNWSSYWAFHTTQPADRIDGDKDEFMDLPLVTRYSFFNKWKKGNEAEWGGHTTIGLRYVDEKRVGGQMDFDEGSDKGGTDSYGQVVSFRQPEFFVKSGFRWDDTHNLVFMGSGLYHDQESYYGTLQYKANQRQVYMNLQYERNFSDKSVLKTGASFRHSAIDENIRFTGSVINRNYNGMYEKTEYIPGLFAEHTLSGDENKFVWIAGIRMDHHNSHGVYFTPRSLLKIQATENTTARLSAGFGWRTANVFSENVNLLASSRNIIFTEELEPEKAFNTGFNIIQNLSSDNWDAYFSLDYYLTRFQNQIFPDYDSSPTIAYIYNFTNKSIAHSFKAELNLNYNKTIGFKIAYNYLDVYRHINQEKYVLPFNAKHKFLTTFSYQPSNRSFQLDANIHWIGKQKLINTTNHPENFRLGEYSDSYTQFNIQFTKQFTSFEIYVGVENLFDFRQEQPILSWGDPFGPYFDTSTVWGPTRGREAYLGVRYTLFKKEAF